MENGRTIGRGRRRIGSLDVWRVWLETPSSHSIAVTLIFSVNCPLLNSHRSRGWIRSPLYFSNGLQGERSTLRFCSSFHNAIVVFLEGKRDRTRNIVRLGKRKEASGFEKRWRSRISASLSSSLPSRVERGGIPVISLKFPSMMAFTCPST